MSDMSSQRITIRVPKQLSARLRDRSRVNGQTPSDVVRTALEEYLGSGGNSRSAFDLAAEAGLIGCVQGARRDLSVNPRHFRGFGEKR